MKLNLEQDFKSLTPFEIELPDFTVITGVNGAGKSQLLFAIKNNLITADAEKKLSVIDILYVQSYGLVPRIQDVINKQAFDNNLRSLFTRYDQVIKSSPIIQSSNPFGNDKQSLLIEQIIKLSGKPSLALTLSDFYEFYPVNDYSVLNIFTQDFSSTFKRYYEKYDNNRYKRYFANEKADANIEYLSEQEFIQTFQQAPWDFMNDILSTMNSEYRVNNPIGLYRGADFQVKIIHKTTKAMMDFIDLSSGEKVIMSLALALYNAKTDLEFPKLLLLDEPDASLHPSMTKQFLDVIKNVFVKEKGVKVIMTTHSPSTVALCDAESLFVMNKTEPRIEKTTKDKALKILTTGVPSLSINYENRRQIFVESAKDVAVYDRLYQYLRDRLESEVSLSFIEAGNGETGGKEKVKKIVNDLVKNGNKTVYGIIDWDTSNNPSKYIKVLGHKKRYSIENFVFDPLIITAYLLREKIVSRKDLGLSKEENHYIFKELPNSRLSDITSYVIKKLASKLQISEDQNTTISYVGGKFIDVPLWILRMNGHDLEEHLKSSFPRLIGISKNRDLKAEVIEKVIDDIPEFIPLDILELFQEIQNQ